MAMHLHWYLPTSGDSRDITAAAAGRSDLAGVGTDRPATLAYLTQVAQAAELLGFEAVLTPTGTWCEDSWIACAMLANATDRLKFLVAFRPGTLTPTLAAQQVQTFQRLSQGRLLLNIVTGGDPVEQARFGDRLSHDDRYRRTAEFIDVLRGVSASGADGPFDYAGQFFDVAGATALTSEWGMPPLFLGGASGASEDVAAAHIDVALTWGEPPAAVGERVRRIQDKAAELGRTLEFGIRLHVITRDTAAEAWGITERMLAALDPADIAKAQEAFTAGDSVGQRRMQQLHGGRLDSLEVSPNLWAGFGLVRGGAGTALVGSHEEVAERLEEYAAQGISHFILSGQPHLEEAYAVAEGPAALLRARGLVEPH